jgi:uncharacterized protein YjbJ (UPF0337 family)
MDTAIHVFPPDDKRSKIMNKDQVKGRAHQAVGKAKEVAGDATDNSKLQAKGVAQQAKGKAQANYGDAKNSVAKKIDR